MEKKIAGVLGAMAALSTMTAAQATPTDVLRANSFAELLDPISDAAARLKALDERQASEPDAANVQLAQFYHHHHHHHHHGYWHHHHHHWRAPIVVVPRRHYHHHHHHHHHSFYRRDY